MRIILRLLAAVLLLGTIAWWIQTGRNPGWTKNRVAVEKKDEITEIVYTEYDERFVPGVELLAASGAAALLLAAISFVRRNKMPRGYNNKSQR